MAKNYVQNFSFKFFISGKFIVECENFWTLPHSYSTMNTKDSELYEKLSNSQLLIFKGNVFS